MESSKMQSISNSFIFGQFSAINSINSPLTLEYLERMISRLVLLAPTNLAILAWLAWEGAHISKRSLFSLNFSIYISHVDLSSHLSNRILFTFSFHNKGNSAYPWLVLLQIGAREREKAVPKQCLLAIPFSQSCKHSTEPFIIFKKRINPCFLLLKSKRQLEESKRKEGGALNMVICILRKGVG